MNHTKWNHFLEAHKDKTIYTIYNLALQSGLKPPIKPPKKPNKRRSREELARVQKRIRELQEKEEPNLKLNENDWSDLDSDEQLLREPPSDYEKDLRDEESDS